MKGIISANSLFHFTRNKDSIISILENGFYPRCCMENIEFLFEPKFRNGFAPTEIAIPMVCFCDIPLSQIDRHIKNYGGYALGLSKEWGEKKGINPVMYELPNSNPIKIIRSSFSKTMKYVLGQYLNTEEGSTLQEIGNELLFYSCYLKPYKGKKWDRVKNKFSDKDIRFYDEREWRYIPALKSLQKGSIKTYITKNDYLNNEIKDNYNRCFEVNFKLDFTPSDIKYIIVEKEIEVLEMAKTVEEIKVNFCKDEQKLLITKILSLDRIKDDF